MLVGLTCHVDDYRTHYKAFPNAAFGRVFAAPGEGLPAWTSPRLANLPPTVAPWVSFKDFPTPDVLIRWCDQIRRTTYLTWYHERDNNPGAEAQSVRARADYFARWRELVDILNVHPNRHLIKAIPVQTLQWTAARSSSTHIKGDGDWRTWWAGVGDGIGIDVYADSWAARYPNPEALLRIPFEMAEGTGRPLWLAELGSVRLAGDTGTGRAAWITDVLTLLRERGAAGAAWWCAIGKPGAKGEIRDFHLSDKASADAWLAAMNAGS